MARPAPGWCDRPLQKPPIERFVPQGLFPDMKRLTVRGTSLQTTPVPLRDRCRCATAVAVRHIPS